MNARITNGLGGGMVIADTDTHTPDKADSWVALQVLADAVISSVTGNVTGLAGPTLPAGSIIFGRFSVITLTSGTVVAYNIH